MPPTACVHTPVACQCAHTRSWLGQYKRSRNPVCLRDLYYEDRTVGVWRCANNFPYHAHSACVRGMWQNTTTIHKPDPSEGPSATVIYRARQLVLLDEHLKRIIDEFMR